MQRILCILSSLDAGGAETFLMKISRALPSDRYQLDFIVSKEGGCYTAEILSRGGRIFSIPKRREDPIGALRGIQRIVRENSYAHVLKLGETPVSALDLLAGKLGGAKHLALRSCNAFANQSFLEKCANIVLRPLLNHVADIKIAPSMLAAEYMFGTHRAHKDVHLLHNGVDLQMFRFDPVGRVSVHNELSLSGKLVIGHVGRFHEQKNHWFLLNTFRIIRDLRKDAVLLLVGTGTLEKQIREWIRELKLEGSVILAGQRFDIPQILSAMDVFVFPSFYEGMPNTVIEAQATGLPCVIADTITSEADITGLVQYLPLTVSPEEWAKAAIKAAEGHRRDTAEDFKRHGYDIESVAEEFLSIMGCDEEDFGH